MNVKQDLRKVDILFFNFFGLEVHITGKYITLSLLQNDVCYNTGHHLYINYNANAIPLKILVEVSYHSIHQRFDIHYKNIFNVLKSLLKYTTYVSIDII